MCLGNAVFTRINTLLLAGAAMALTATILPAQTNTIPVPEKRPENTIMRDEPTKENKPFAPKITLAPIKPSAQDQKCFAKLKQIGVKFKRLSTITEENGCGILIPVSISSLPSGIALVPASQLSCQAALATANWIKNEVLPAANILYPDDKLKTIRHGSTYACRNRNRQTNTKLSEHAKGNAIDITAFVFESGNTITIEPRQRTGKLEEGFQKAVRFGACLHFTTVIGPFSDEFHADHLHLDTAMRRGGYRLCRLPEIKTPPPAEPSAN